ncbi:MAG: hypothetical protein J6D87_01250 [Clostridia bacterium]|nr:hypothetical protein [Clostridia bacterium]
MRKTMLNCKPLRLLFLCLLLVLTVGLIACGGDTVTNETPTDATTEATASEALTDALTEAPTDGSSEAPSEAPTEQPSNEVTEIPTEEITEAPTEAPTEAVTDVMIGETLDAPYAADFSVSNVFSNDMVVQRNEHIRVWGTAPASENGKKVSGEFKGMFAEALIQDGKWTLTFGARMEASVEMGHTMKIYTDKKAVEFTNVLVGDVYMVIGQSNVAYAMNEHWNANNTDDKAGKNVIDGDAPIRIHYNSLGQVTGYPQRGTEEVCDELKNGSVWQKATLANIGRFSAIGYLFAYNYIDITDNKIPVGIIEIDGNGQPLGAFMPNEVAEACKTDRFNKSKGYYVTTGVNADWGRYMYNHYMNPFEKYAIAGVLWYQGESDFQVTNARVFAENFSALMTYMRGTHNLVSKDFPVYFIEFPTNYQQHPNFVASAGAPFWAAMDVGLIRSVMGSIPQILPNSYQVVSSDLWLDDTYWNTLHPNCKFEQGQRAAKVAAAVQGLRKMEEAAGPILVSVEWDESGKKAVLTYENVGDGLKTSDGGTDVTGFALLTNSYGLTQDQGKNIVATITAPNQITVESKRAFVGLAYNSVYWNVYGEHVNLCNSEGVPAGATLFFNPEA